MIQARFMTFREPYPSQPAPLSFPGQGEGPGLDADEADSDWDEIEMVGVIEREGLLRTESLAGDWE